jgi:rare lipoprotein A
VRSRHLICSSTLIFAGVYGPKILRVLRPAAGLLLLSCCVFMTACTHQKPQIQGKKPPYNPNDGRYSQAKDSGPDGEPDMSHVPDAVPRYEVRTSAGNRNPYTVLGKTYHLIEDESSYRERGYSSWYGNKFNGYHTSNGEVYNMYAMSGAHKTLPIPSYVRVTNVANGKSVVVRINDRGPFHEGRIIDLSYAAAQRIGINKVGTGLVDVEIALPTETSGVAIKPAAGAATAGLPDALPEGTYLQVGAFSNNAAAQQLAASLGGKLSFPVIVQSLQQPKEIHRVRVGPFKDARSLQLARDQLARVNLLQAHVVYQ